MEIVESGIFSTRDLTLAATLITLKFFMLGIDYQIEGLKNMPVGYFKFTDSPLLQDALLKFKQGLISVEPKTFNGHIKDLKSEVMNAYRNPHNPIK